MNIAIIEVYSGKILNKTKMIDAHLRNSVIISNFLTADLLCTENDFLYSLRKKYDVFILGHVSRYAQFDLIKKLLKQNPKTIRFMLSNEYNQNRTIGGYIPCHVIANYKDNGIKNLKHNTHNSYFLNLNLLLAKKRNKTIKKKYDCIYYGTFRPNREKYFKKYLQANIYLSSSEKNFKKYKHVGCNPKYIKKFSWVPLKEQLNLFKYSLYIEDEYTHDCFNNLANRFYEALFCNVVQFFDISCKNTIEKSRIIFDDYFYVSSLEELQQKIRSDNWEQSFKFQKQWNVEALVQREKMLQDLKKIIYDEANNAGPAT